MWFEFINLNIILFKHMGKWATWFVVEHKVTYFKGNDYVTEFYFMEPSGYHDAPIRNILASLEM
jgi:hypothetical protein